MLSDDLEFNRRLAVHSCLYRYPLWEEDGEGVDMTWCVVLDDEEIERKGDSFPVYEIPEGRLALLDEFVWSMSGGTDETVVGGSVGRVTLDGHYHITINAAARSLETLHLPLKRPIPYFAGEWIGVCTHLLGDAHRSSFRITLRFREYPMPARARPGKMVEPVPMGG
jgi:hypothetical protein